MIKEKMELISNEFSLVESNFNGISEKKELSKKCLIKKRIKEGIVFNLLCDLIDSKDLEELKKYDYFNECKVYFNSDRKVGNVKVNYEGMGVMEVFEKYDYSIRDMKKRGYKVENDVYVKE